MFLTIKTFYGYHIVSENTEKILEPDLFPKCRSHDLE